MGCLHGRRANVGGVFALVACMVDVPICRQRARVTCQRGLHGLCISVGKVDGVLTWFVWLAY